PHLSGDEQLAVDALVCVAGAPRTFYTHSLHDALPISNPGGGVSMDDITRSSANDLAERLTRGELSSEEISRAFLDRVEATDQIRSEEHTSELQSRFDLVCRLLLEKINIRGQNYHMIGE